MESKKYMFRSVALLAGIFFLITSAATASTATSVVSFNKLASIEIILPSQILMEAKPPFPSTRTYSDYVIVQSDVAWDLNVWGSNNGHMVSKNDLLYNPLNIEYTGNDGSIIPPAPNPLSVAETDKRYVSGEGGSTEQIPTTFMQQFIKKDKPGYYGITLGWTAVPAP